MQGAQAGEFRFQIHQVVKTVDHFAQLFGAADHIEDGRLIGIFDLHVLQVVRVVRPC